MNPGVLTPPYGELFSHLDRHFAGFMQRLAGAESAELFFAAALVSRLTREGHICLDLTQLDDPQAREALLGEGGLALAVPDSATLAEALLQSPVVGQPGEFKPLVLDQGHRLYLYRYWQYEQKLAQFIRARAQETLEVANPAGLAQALERYFASPSAAEIDWQKVAAATVLLKPLCVITGGPGTGKTYTVGKILALLVEQAQANALRIKLAAPTGKAAVRLQESIRKVKQSLSCPDEIKQAIPEEAATLHRLLGTVPNSPYFRHDAEQPLDLDVLVVDEASMVDLALMSKLVQALPERARLILLGDNHQLASVEAGAVLADICDTGREHRYSEPFARALAALCGTPLQRDGSGESAPGLQDCIVRLRKNYRFESEAGIHRLSQAVNNGEAEEALHLLQSESDPELAWHRLDENPRVVILERLQDFNGRIPPEEAFARLARFRVLCAVREGPQGVNTLNAEIARRVKRAQRVRRDTHWYPGQPVLITENDYNLSLFNGDVGLVALDPEGSDGQLLVHFPSPEGGFRTLSPLRLPRHELAYAMSVHKSQGSEFEEVLLLLPERDSPILTRELIYTAVTRASKKVSVWGNEAVFTAAVRRRIRRSSGLRDALWAASGQDST